MDRIKSKILKNSELLKEECEAIKTLLGDILEKNEEVVGELANITERDIATSKKYLLSVVQYQSTVLQKLLEMSVDIDVFSAELPAPASESSLTMIRDVSRSEISLCSPRHQSVVSIPNKLFLEDDEACIAETSTAKVRDIIQDEVKQVEHTKINSNVSQREEQVVIKPRSKSPHKNKSPSKKECNITSENEGNNFAVVLPEHQNSKVAAVTKDDSSPNKKNCEVICENEGNKLTVVLPRQQDFEDAVAANDSSSDTSSMAGNKEVAKSSADVSSSEDVGLKVNGNGRTIHEKLKSKKLMTRRDRFLQNLQRPDIPDLSFRPSSKVAVCNEIYLTCPDSSSSTSVCKIKDKKRKKKQADETSSSTLSKGPIGYRKPAVPYKDLDCLISRIVNPSEFYINHLDENVALVDTMSYQLAEIYRDTKSPYKDKKTAMEALGSDCVCYLENYGVWYRVTVTNWRLQAMEFQEKMVTVHLVDYGHTCDSSYENLRELSEEFCRVPQCAIRCHLAWLYPPGSTKDNLLETWPKASNNFFQSLFSKNSDSIYKVVYAEKCGSSWGIDLISSDPDNPSEVTFGQQMLDKDVAVEVFQDTQTLFKDSFILNQIKTAQGMAGFTPGMTDEERLEQFSRNMDSQEYNNIDQAMVGYRARDEARICKNVRPDGTCFKGKRCKLEHEKLRKDGVTTDKQIVYVSAFNELEMPEIGSKIKLRIINVTSVNTFYACIINSQSKTLNALIKTMNKRETIAKYKPLEIQPAPGELVIAKSWNNSWYRASVRDIFHHPQNPQETVQVFFVDLGELVDLTSSQIRAMEPDFLHLPFQAIRCRLYNVKPKPNSSLEEAKDYVERHFLCQIFDAEVKHASHSTLEVLLKREGNLDDVGELIIDDGYGDLRTDHRLPVATESVLVD